MPDRPANLFWRVPIGSQFDQLHSSAKGLASVEAAERLTRVGPNTVAEAPRRRLIAKIAKRVVDRSPHRARRP
jgi:Mg2+-importing ATPase